MKKLLFTLVLIFALLISCEKEEIKLNETFTSELFKLANLDSVQLNLVINESIIQNIYLNPYSIEYKYSFKINTIFNYNDDLIISKISYKFQSYNKIYHGTLEIKKIDSKNYIGYLNIENDKWKDILCFK